MKLRKNHPAVAGGGRTRIRKPGLQPGQKLQLTIERFDHEGAGIARYDGRPVFVSGAIPGEQVEVILTDVRRKFIKADCHKVSTPAVQRVTPVCPAYGVCGGCTLQHLSHDSQLAMKEDSLRQQLEKFADCKPGSWMPAIRSSDSGYRNRIRMRIKGGKIGFNRKASHHIVEVTHCMLFASDISELLGRLRALRLPDGEVDLVIQRERIVCSLSFRSGQSVSGKLRNGLNDISQAGLCTFFVRSGDDLIWSDHEGSLSYEMTVCGNRLTIGFLPWHFIQVNKVVNERMVNQALALLDLQDGDRVADLFSGSGNFSVPLACRGIPVLAIEGSEELVAQGHQNADINHVDQVCFRYGDLFRPGLKKTLVDHAINKVLLDPPRDGAEQACREISETGSVTDIVYVSCNASTLARDTGILTEGGFVMTEAGVMDMFPHTAHIECMARFCRQK